MVGTPGDRWREGGWLVATGIAVSLAAACRLDDRVLSSGGLGGSGGTGGSGGSSGGDLTCVDRGTSACETCLYGECCAETRACEDGSACVQYLECAEACTAGDGCLAECSRQYSAGFRDAVALGACGQTECPSCSRNESNALAGCDGVGAGACQSSADCGVLNDGTLDDLDTSACPACGGLAGGLECATCISGQTGLSAGCSGCVSDWLSCAVLYCASFCSEGLDQASCDACLAESGCSLVLGACAFTG